MKFIAVDDSIAEALRDGFIPIKEILSDIYDCKSALRRANQCDWYSDKKSCADDAIEFLIRRLGEKVKKAQLRGFRSKAERTETQKRNYYKF